MYRVFVLSLLPVVALVVRRVVRLQRVVVRLAQEWMANARLAVARSTRSAR